MPVFAKPSFILVPCFGFFEIIYPVKRLDITISSGYNVLNIFKGEHMKREHKQIIKTNREALIASERNLAAVYSIMFRYRDNLFSEYDDGFRIRRYTYGEVYDMAERAAGSLYARIGATHGFVGLEAENCVEWIIAFWAILRSGNKPYLVNCRHPKTISDGIIKTLNIKTILSMKKGELEADYINIPSLLGESEKAPTGLFENEIALSTSATTLKETICCYNGSDICELILNSEKIVKENELAAAHYNNALKLLAFLPFYHVFGLFAVYFWFAFYARSFVFLRDYSPDTILKTCRKLKVTHIFAVPMLWHTIEEKLRKELSQKDEKTQKRFARGLKISNSLQNAFPILGGHIARRLMKEVTDKLFGDSVRFCISGGSYIRKSALELINGIGYPLYNGYGMSEVGITSVELRLKPKYRVENSIGQPLPSVKYRISDDGTLSIAGTSLCSRITVSGETREMPEWFETGDIVEERNGYYFVKGRKGDLVIGEGGENINPDIIEQHFPLAGCRQISVLGIVCGGKEVLSMVMQISEYTSAEKLKAISSEMYRINDTLPSAVRIQRFYATCDPIVPPNAVKVSRPYLIREINNRNITLRAVSEMLAELPQSSEGEINPRIAEKVKAAVAEVLGINAGDIGDDAHFVNDLGASSLQYFAIVGILSKEFGIASEGGTDSLFYTVRECTEFIERYI